MSEVFAWDKGWTSDEKKQSLLSDRILELTLDPDKKFTKEEIANQVNRSASFVYLTWDRLCETCTCGHQREAHKDKCKYFLDSEFDVVQCDCAEFVGKLAKNEFGHILRKKPDRMVNSYNDIKKTNFVTYASVKRWIEGLQKSKVIHWKTMLANFWRVCKTVDVHPDAFLQDIQTAETLKDKFITLFRDGKAVYIYEWKGREKLKQSQSNPQSYIEVIRSFRLRNNKEIPKGYLTIERDQTDTYARVHLTDVQRQIAIHYLQNIDPEMAVIFIMQHELGVRAHTVFTMRPFWEKKLTVIDGETCEYYKALIFERKQNRNYEKLIFTPEAVEVIKKLPNDKPVHGFKVIKEAKKKYNERLREVYVLLGKISDNQKEWNEYERGTQEWYYVNNPSHVIRHSAIHKLMRVTGERAEVVSGMFWDEPETLKIYKKSSIDSILQQGLCGICNRPSQESEYEMFCTLRHALLYYNKIYKHQEAKRKLENEIPN